MAIVTLAQLRTRVRSRAEMTSTDIMADGGGNTELNYLINESYEELFERVNQAFTDWFVFTQDKTIPGGNEANARWPLPEEDQGNPPSYEYRYTLTVEKDPDTTRRRILDKFSRQSQPRGPLWIPVAGLTPWYRVEDQYIVIEPYEAAAGNYRHRYVGAPWPLFDGDGDLAETDMDQRLVRFAEYVVVRTAIKCKDKEESDTSGLWAELARISERIDIAAVKRDAGAPRVVPDVDDFGWR